MTKVFWQRAWVLLPLSTLLVSSVALAEVTDAGATPEASTPPPASAYPVTTTETGAADESALPPEPVPPPAPTPVAPIPATPPADSRPPAPTAAPPPGTTPTVTAPPERPWRIDDAVLIVSADRLVGFHSWSYEFDQDGAEFKEERSGTMFNFLGANATGGNPGSSWRPVNPSALPRVGADVLLGRVTIGGVLTYISTSGESEQTTDGTTSSIDDPDSSLLLVGVRGGVLVPWTTQMAFWPRAGLYRASYSEESDFSEFTVSETVLSLEPVVLLTPVPHVGITFGPVLDFSLAGEAEVNITQDAATIVTRGDLGVSNLGVTAGIAGLF